MAKAAKRGRRVIKAPHGLYLAEVERVGDGFTFEQTCWYTANQRDACKYRDRKEADIALASIADVTLRIVRLRPRPGVPL